MPVPASKRSSNEVAVPVEPIPSYLAKISDEKGFRGSGILVAPSLVLTCAHVVEQSDKNRFAVRIGNRTISGTVIQRDAAETVDLALIQLARAVRLAPHAWSDDVDSGHQCECAAYPAGEYDVFQASVSHVQKRAVYLTQTLLEGSSGGSLSRLIQGAVRCVGILRRRENASLGQAVSTAVVQKFLASHGIELNVACPATPVIPSRKADSREYFSQLRNLTREIDLDRLKVPREGARAPRIDLLYIPLKTAAPGTAKPPSGQNGERVIPAAVSLESMLKHRRLVFEGAAGSGKTTFLRRIAWQLCPKDRKGPKGREEKPGENNLKLPCNGFPMFIRISSLDRHIHHRRPEDRKYKDVSDPRWLAHYLAAQPGGEKHGLDEQFFEEQLRGPNNIVLLDGLDEAADRARREAVAKLVVRASGSGCRYVVTMRPRADEGAAAIVDFQKCSVLPLEDPSIEEFLRTWCLWLGRDEVYRKRLVADVGRTPRQMRSNPFMLTAFAVVYLQQKRLPEERAELYEAIVLWLSEQARDRLRENDYREDDILRWTGCLALAMQNWNGTGQRLGVGLPEAADRIRHEFRPDPPYTERQVALKFLELAQQESGLLTLSYDSGEEQISFWHRELKEYMAARYLVSAYLPDEYCAFARAFLYSPEGREILPLAAGRLQKLSRGGLDLLFRTLIEDAAEKTELSEQAYAVGVLGSMLRDLRRTTYALRPEAQIECDALVREVMWIFEPGAGEKSSLRVRIDAAEALGAAYDPRLVTPEDAGYWFRVPAGRFRMGDGDAAETPVRDVAAFDIGRFPVTVWEYGLYLNSHPESIRPALWDEQVRHENRPVVGVSWAEADAYCEWAACRYGGAIALADEARWEFAAGGNHGQTYPWGSKAPTAAFANYDECGTREPTPVGLFPLGNARRADDDNEPGIADMAGNVWEWTSNDFDPEGMTKVVRGGSFSDSAGCLRAAYRLWVESGGRGRDLGFRCVRK